MGEEVLRLHEVTEERQFWSDEALLLECWVDHALPVAEEVYELLVAGILGLAVVAAVLEGNVRKRNQLPNLQGIVGLRNDLLKVSAVFRVNLPLKVLIDALGQEDHLLINQPQDARRVLLDGFDGFWGWVEVLR